MRDDDRHTVRLLVALLAVVSAVAAFAIGGLIATSGERADQGNQANQAGRTDRVGTDGPATPPRAVDALGDLRDGAGSLPAAIGQLGIGGAADSSPPTRDPADRQGGPYGTPTPMDSLHAVKGVASAETPTATPSAPSSSAPRRTCAAPPTAATGGSGPPIMIYPLC